MKTVRITKVCLLNTVHTVYGKTVNYHVKRITEPLAGEKQGGFKNGRGCMGEIFALMQVLERIPEKKM